MTEPRRKTLTPMTGEQRPVAPPGRLARLRRPRRQRPLPTTWQAALARGLKRLAIVLWAAAIVALLVDKFLLPYRDPALGFYLVGAVIGGTTLASANGAGMSRASSFTNREQREQRVNASFSYFLVAVVVLVIGALIEAFAPSWQL